jgi:hypothetical protein
VFQLPAVFSAPEPPLPVPLRFVIPRSLYPPASLLGRLVRRWAGDARQAESLYVVAAALVLCVGMLISQWGWIVFGTDPTSAVAYFAAQVIGGAVLVGTCMLGWRPRVVVTARDRMLDVRQGAEALSLHYGRIHAAERISADAYHRHWRRYAATRAFVGRLPDELLLLRTPSGPVVLGLGAPDLDRLETHLADCVETSVDAHLVRAA